MVSARMAARQLAENTRENPEFGGGVKSSSQLRGRDRYEDDSECAWSCQHSNDGALLRCDGRSAGERGQHNLRQGGG